MTVNLRQTPLYVLGVPPKSIVLRNIVGYALSKPPKQPNYALTPQASLLAQMNKQYGTSFGINDVVFETVTALTGDAAYNTTISVRALPSSRYKSAKTMRYNRFDLSFAFSYKPDTAIPTSGMGSTIWTSLTAINTKFGLTLTTADVADANIASQTGFNLTALSTSLYFNPGSVQRIGV